MNQASCKVLSARCAMPVIATIAFALAGSRGVAAADGAYDTTWAGNGRFSFAADLQNDYRSSQALQVEVQADGTLLLGGDVPSGSSYSNYWWLGELTPGGAPVTTFGAGDGSGRTTVCALRASLCAAGRSLTGFARSDSGTIGVAEGASVVLVAADGHSLDTGGGPGIKSFPFQINDAQGTFEGANTLAASAGGKFLAFGSGYYSTARYGNADFAVARLNSNLSLDGTFNNVTNGAGVTFSGGALVAFDLGYKRADYVAAAAFAADGSMVLYGMSETNTSVGLAVTLSRLKPSGSLDTSFGNLGRVVTDPSYAAFYAHSVRVDAAGRIVFVLHYAGSGGLDVVRLLGDGSPDYLFGVAGISSQSSPLCTGGARAASLAIDSAGRILVAGECTTDFVTNFFVERLFGDDGSPDTSFGSSGYVFGAFDPSSTLDEAADVVFDHSGHPVIVGYSNVYGKLKSGIARLSYDLVFTANFETTPAGRLPGQ